MTTPFPPPDPHESLGMQPPDQGTPTEAVFFTRGVPSPLDERMSSAILRARPGVLIVLAAG